MKGIRLVLETLDGKKIFSTTGEFRQFSSGKFGYYLNGKAKIEGASTYLQVGCNAIFCKSEGMSYEAIFAIDAASSATKEKTKEVKAPSVKEVKEEAKEEDDVVDFTKGEEVSADVLEEKE